MLLTLNIIAAYLALIGVVGLDVPDVVPGELVDGLLDLGQAALLAHPLRREVGVRSRPAPLALQNTRKVILEGQFKVNLTNKMTMKSKIVKYLKHAEISKKLDSYRRRLVVDLIWFVLNPQFPQAESSSQLAKFYTDKFIEKMSVVMV